MNTVEKVLLRELAGAVTLVGEPGNSEVITGPGGKRLLRGRFAAEIGGHCSEFLDVGANSEVTEQGGSFTIRATPRLQFKFAQPVVIQPHPNGPWMAFQRASLIVEAKTGAPVLFSLDGAGISLIPDLPPAADGYLHFPTSGGAGAVALRQVSSGSLSGNFVRPLPDGGFGTIFGGTGSSATLDPHAGIGVIIVNDARIVFAIDRTSGSQTVADDETRQPLTIQDAGSVLGGITLTVHPSTGGVSIIRSKMDGLASGSRPSLLGAVG